MNSTDTNDEANRSLRDIDLPVVIDTSRHDLRREFYDPCLGVATEYKRAVGYFSSRWFSEAATGVASLVKNNGHARWIISPIISKKDAEAAIEGCDARDYENSGITDVIGTQINALEEELAADTRNAIGWLIAEDYLDIRIAKPTSHDGAMFHDKFGVIADEEGNRISFHGSKNDSYRAFRNHEGYTIDCDWLGERDQATVLDHNDRFERLWNDEVDGLRVEPLPAAAKDGLLELRTTERPPYNHPSGDGGTPMTLTTESETDDQGPLRDNVTLRDYQEDALTAWIDNDHQGIIEMATGLGKTITAMAGIDKFADSLETNLLVVIAVPESYLGRQWEDELDNWGFDGVEMVYGSENRSWPSKLAELVASTALGAVSPGIAITTHDGFQKEKFRKHIENAGVPCMLIADEVHGVGTENRQEGLDEMYAGRLGLSATPQRYMDQSGTEALEDYFSGTVFEYGLAEGIPEYLSEYEYHPCVVELTEDEIEEYIAESQRLAATIGSESADEDQIRSIAQQRAEYAKTAAEKIPALRRTLKNLPSQEDIIVFSHEAQMEEVSSELHAQDIKYHHYTQDEGTDERERLLESFGRRDGGLDALVGIHCLDEGVDVSSAQTAILMSSTGNPRQFIQRRGRVLRQDENKDIARIYDFIVIPPRDHFDDLLDSERQLIRSQLDRHREFAQTATNSEEAEEEVRLLQEALEE